MFLISTLKKSTHFDVLADLVRVTCTVLGLGGFDDILAAIHGANIHTDT